MGLGGSLRHLIVARSRAAQCDGISHQSKFAGRDQGADIVAYPDPFRFETPRVKIQGKYRKGPAIGDEVGRLRGRLQNSDHGLFVSSGGFTKDAFAQALIIPNSPL